MKMKRLFSILALTLTFVLVFTNIGFAKATTMTDNVVVPFTGQVPVPCAPAGGDEFINVSGNLHMLTEVTENASGGYHLVILHNPQGITGYGQTTGDEYQGTGSTLTETNISGLPSQYTYVNNFRIIGHNTGNNYLIHETTHVTINAQGETTADVNDVSITCK